MTVETQWPGGDNPPESTSQSPRVFPGGTVKLPRLTQDISRPTEVDYVGTAFVRSAIDDASPADAAAGTFTEYFTAESLFAEAEIPEEVETTDDGENPFEVLRVPEDADWPTIVRRHRVLVKEFHPDRFVGFDQSVLEEAEIEIRRINKAYGTLRKRHAGSS
jgi:hypothetical protein